MAREVARGTLRVMTTKKLTEGATRELVFMEPADGADVEALADKIGGAVADLVVREVNRQRAAAGKPPLKK
jgi:hypothetical protein